MAPFLSERFFILLIPLAFCALIFGYNPTSSFWLDETVTAWIISGSFMDVIVRTLEYQAQSPLYYILVWLWSQLAGSSEVSLRLPSMLFSVITLVALYWCARPVLSFGSTLVALLLLISHPDFARAVLSARPYALALAALVSGVYLLERAIGTRSGRALAAAQLMFILCFYAHYLVLLTALPLLVFRGYALVKKDSVSRAFTLAGSVVFVAALLPGLFHLLKISERARQYSFAPELTPLIAIKAVIPPESTLLLLIAVVTVCCFIPRSLLQFRRLPPGALPGLLLWAFAPPFLLIVFSVVTGNSIVISRYSIGASAGFSLLGAWSTGMLAISRSHLFVAAALTVLLLVVPRRWELQNWRGDMAQIEKESLILIYTGLVEAESEEWMLEQKNHPYLTAPVQVYRPGQRALPIARIRQDDYREKFISPSLRAVEEVTLIVPAPLADPTSLRAQEERKMYERFNKTLEWEGFARIDRQFQDGAIVQSGHFGELHSVLRFKRVPSL